MKSDPGHIIHYYFKRLHKNASRIEKGFNEKLIHLFRIDVKKLRAFLRMMRLEAEEPGELKFPSAFKKMYSLAGKIRDGQLYLERLKKTETSSENRLHKTISSFEKKLEDLMEKKDSFLTNEKIKEIEEKIKKYSLHKIGATLIKKFFLQKIAVIKEIIIQEYYKDKEVHNLRKNIKDIIYIAGIYRDDLKTRLPFMFWNKTEFKKAGELAHTLGQFNDVRIALSLLKPADIKKKDSDEKELLLSIRMQWLAEKRKLKIEILNKIPMIKWNL